jgi:hypothetical protein
MIGGRIAFLVLGALSAVRGAVLLRKKGYRAFPLLMLLFLFGSSLAAYGASKYLAGDISLRPSGKGSGVAWYQDFLGGIGLAIMAVVVSVGYSSSRKTSRSPKAAIAANRSLKSHERS